MSTQRSGQAPFVFSLCEDLYSLPERARACETQLHGGFAVDKRPDQGYIYYGMPGCGLMRISPNLVTQEIIELPPYLRSTNFHSTKIGQFDGKTRLFMPANSEAMVAILTLEGEVDFVLPRPVFEEYASEETPFRPTDTVLDDSRLFVADGYGANYISEANPPAQQWRVLFGGKTSDSHDHGKFGTAHGIARTPTEQLLAIADRPHSRIELFSFDGEFDRSYALPAGSRPCGIDYLQWGDSWYAVIGSLDDPQPGRPAPIYILDGTTYTVLSTIRPKEDLGVDLADHLHNVVWHVHDGQLYLICQAWNPGHYFVLALEN
jgi:hypothetical protein